MGSDFLRQCPRCGIEKPESEFRRKQHRLPCKSCLVDYTRQWRAKNPERWKALKDRHRGRTDSHKRNLRVNYHMSIEQFDQIFERQGGKCPICGKSLLVNQKRRLHIDHKSVDGQIKVRALLCPECNKGIGLFYHKPLLLEAAAGYVEVY